MLNKEKLTRHLRKWMAKRFEARAERYAELAEWFYGPGGSDVPENLRDMTRLYNEAYWDGAVDAIASVLTYDSDIRGVEAYRALLKEVEPAEG